jgi:hypothetical protein
MADANQCSATKNDGEPCTFTAKYDDGKCGVHSDENPRQDPGGRPSELGQYKDDILHGAEQGMTLAGCARMAGVAEKTLHAWLNKHDEFRKSLRRARAQGELKRLDNVNESGSRFILERSYGYVKTEKREHTGDEDNAIVFNVQE